MEDLKLSRQADLIANLYRCALYMARGNITTALQFLQKSSSSEFRHLSKELLLSEKNRKYWAEKILDQYLRMKNSNFTKKL